VSNTDILRKWTNKDSVDLYGIRYWGNNYFGVSENGEVTVNIHGKNGSAEISIYEIITGLIDRGFSLPILLRFKDLLSDRLVQLYKCFNNAFKEYGYNNVYRGVYPIKVNQQEEVIKEIADAGKEFHHGFEVGSKAELIAGLSCLNDTEAFIICNGYKDTDFIDLALYSLKLGMKTILVVERPNELELIINRARELEIKPRIGFRVKLSSKGDGHWADSAGYDSVFGLTTAQIINALDLLKENNFLKSLELLHYHIGSQISDIKNIRTAISEAVRFYAELVNEGAEMGILDIGGGLAVDYDGSKTNFKGSKNYSLQEYCSDIVEGIINTLKDTEIPCPVIISESGRSLIAYYSVLLFDILDINKFENIEIPEQLSPDSHEYLSNMYDIYKAITVKNLQEVFHDAVYYHDEILSLFIHGDISLREKGISEQIFWLIIQEIAKLSLKLRYVPEELKNLNELLIDTYYGNFSIFQSLPDSWAIDQLFPIMPVHRLNEEPKNPAYIADVTCDCDGKIRQFVDLHDIKKSIYLHDLNDEQYVLGAFIVGAYQETLGDLHNLFGDTNVVSVSLDKNGSVSYVRELTGDSVEDVLSYVEYDIKDLVNRFRSTAESAVQFSKITAKERRDIMFKYNKILKSYTYLQKE
jgi:arginine decarboxylase